MIAILFGQENVKTLDKRIQIKKLLNNGSTYIGEEINEHNRNEIRDYLIKECSVINYGPDFYKTVSQGVDDRGAHGLVKLLKESVQ